MYPEDPLGQRLEIAPGADLTADPDTYTWTDISDRLYKPDGVARGFGSDDEQAETQSSLEFTLKNDDGRFTQDNPLSDLWPYIDVNLPIRYSINLWDGTGWHVRTVQYLAEIDDDWPSGTGNKCLTHITAAGRFRWMGQGRALRSAMNRAQSQPETGKVAYWPLEGGSEVIAPTSGLIGGSDMDVTGTPKFGDRTGVAGSLPVMAMQTGATVYGYTGAAETTATAFCAAFLMNVDTLPASEVIVFSVVCLGGEVVQWDVALNPGTVHDESLYLKAYSINGGGDLVGGTLYNDSIEKNWVWVDVRATQNGGDIDWVISYTVWYIAEDGTPQGDNYSDSGTIVGHAIGKVTSIVIGPNGTLDNIAFGHVVVWNDTIPAQSEYNEVQAWAGESATQRIAGMCSEASIPRTCPDNSTVYMGPQIAGTVLDNLRDSAKTDHGILDDSQGDVTYRCLADLYNLDASMTIDGARRQLALPFKPKRDDSKRRNSVTAKRPKGDGVTYEDAADIATWGLYDSDLSVNVSHENALLWHAQREVNIGIMQVRKYPEIGFDLLRSPELAKDWLATSLGDRVTVINPPRQHTRDDVDLQIRGGSEVIIGARGWRVTLNGVSYRPYEAFERGHELFGRRAAESSTLAAEAAPGATSLSVATASGALWTTDGADFPMSINVAGVQLTCTAIAGASSPQTFTVAWPRADVRKRLPAGSDVDIWHPGLRPLM